MATTDSIIIKNLQLPSGVTAPDVWGKPKEQPALVSLKLVLRGEGFNTAASKDELDNSTIHYGELAKRVRACCQQSQTTDDILTNVASIVREMASKEDGTRFVVARADLELLLPKASMFGSGVVLTRVLSYHESGDVMRGMETAFAVRDVKVMTLVGVNAYERTARQPLVADVAMSWAVDYTVEVSEQRVGEWLFGLEKLLVQTIEESSFETLETLADYTVKQLQERLLNQMLPGSRVHLRLEKPRAIAFADAPAVEVIRLTPGGGRVVSGSAIGDKVPDTAGASKSAVEPKLDVIKPYVG